MEASPETVLFTLGDTSVTVHERNCYQNNAWLNDNSIAFYFDYLTHNMPKLSDQNGDVHPILFMHPSTAWMVNLISDPAELDMCLDQIALKDRKVIFIPINDATDPALVQGGSHWALLAFHRHSNTFFYMDSMHARNMSFAKQTSKNLFPVLGVEKPTFEFVQLKVPQQNNSFDCGVFTLEYCETFYNYILSKGVSSDISLQELTSILEKQISSQTVSQKRASIVSLIDSLASKKAAK